MGKGFLKQKRAMKQARAEELSEDGLRLLRERIERLGIRAVLIGGLEALGADPGYPVSVRVLSPATETGASSITVAGLEVAHLMPRIREVAARLGLSLSDMIVRTLWKAADF